MGDTPGRAEDTELAQSALWRDVETVRRYGTAHPDTWTGVRFDNDPPVRIVACFTRDLAVHRAALRRVVEHPDRLVLEQSRRSESQLEQIRSEIERTSAGPEAKAGRPASSSMALSSTGIRGDVVHVALQADQEHLASELAQRYGDAVDLVVGAPAQAVAAPLEELTILPTPAGDST